MKDTKQNALNFTSLFFYFGLIILTGYFLKKKGITVSEINIKDLVIMTLASYRLTRIIVFEKIFKFFRDFVKSQPGNYLLNTVKYIFSCPWCAGVWGTLIVLVFFYFIPYGDLLVYILAISGIASLLILLANLTGLTVEEKQSKHHPKDTIQDS